MSSSKARDSNGNCVYVSSEGMRDRYTRWGLQAKSNTRWKQSGRIWNRTIDSRLQMDLSSQPPTRVCTWVLEETSKCSSSCTWTTYSSFVELRMSTKPYCELQVLFEKLNVVVLGDSRKLVGRWGVVISREIFAQATLALTMNHPASGDTVRPRHGEEPTDSSYVQEKEVRTSNLPNITMVV